VLGRKSERRADHVAHPAVTYGEGETGTFEVVLRSPGINKIKVIKELRSRTLPHMDLVQARALVLAAEASPQVVLRFASRDQADDAVTGFEAAGAIAAVASGDGLLPDTPVGFVNTATSSHFVCQFCGADASGSHCDNCGAPRKIS
jgi:ribosomal protein L7/L12